MSLALFAVENVKWNTDLVLEDEFEPYWLLIGLVFPLEMLFFLSHLNIDL